jgi:outer membrane protein, heavy metal efflux system
LGIGIAEADLQQRFTQLAYDITAAYAEVSAERHKLKLLSDLIGLNQDTLRLTEARVKEGDVALLEANLLRVEISRAEVSRRSAGGASLRQNSKYAGSSDLISSNGPRHAET